MGKLKILAAAALAGAAGCVSVLPDAPPPAARYLLTPTPVGAAADATVAWTLSIEDPDSTRVYDNTRIAIVRQPGRVDYLAGGEWADRGPRLFQAALIRSFENSGRILGVGDRASLTFSDFVLQTDIRALHARYESGTPIATLSVYARLTDGRGKVFAGRLFERSAPANADNIAEIAAAFDRAVGETLADIVDWSLTAGTEAYAK